MFSGMIAKNHKKRVSQMRSRIHLKSLILTLTIFVVIGTIGSSLLFSILNRIAVKQGENYLNAHTLQHKEEIIQILENAGRVTNSYSENPEFKDFIFNESDPVLKAKAFEKLNKYMLISNSEGWFIAIKNSDNYYFNNISNDFQGSELNRKLFIGNFDDSWFYSSSLDESDKNKNKIKNNYTIRIDQERMTNKKKVWISKNIIVNNKIEAVFGCSFDYSKLTDNFLKDSDNNLETFIVLKDGSIVANKDLQMMNNHIDYLYFEERKNIFHIYNNSKFKENFQQATETLNNNQNITVNFSIKLKDFNKNQSITTVSLFSVNNLNWYMVSSIGLNNIISDKYKILILLLFGFMGILPLAIQVYFIKLQIIKPINNISAVLNAVKHGELSHRVEIIKNRDDEMSSLIFEFNNMLDVIENNNKNSSELYSLLSDNMIDVIWLMDKHENILYISPSIVSLSGFSQAEAMIQSIEDRYSQESVKIFTEAILNYIQYRDDHEIHTLKLEQIHKNKSHIWVEINIKLKIDEVHGIRFIGSTRDISKRLEMEHKVETLLSSDTLTGLVNRKLLTNILQETISNMSSNGTFGAIIDINLDDFKKVNEIYGFHIGDKILVKVGKRLLDSVREIDTVARIGGDEFIILIDHIGRDNNISSEIAYLIAEKIKYIINEPYLIENEQKVIHFTCSIGLRIFDSSDNFEQILRESNLAMYRSKHDGRNKITLWA